MKALVCRISIIYVLYMRRFGKVNIPFGRDRLVAGFGERGEESLGAGLAGFG
jgi:hypothetical protein